MKELALVFRRIGPLYFLIAALPYIIAQIASTWRWKLLLPGHFRFGRLFSLYMIGSFFNSFLPGVIGGDAVKAYYLNKDAKKISLTLASVFMDRYLGYVGLMIIGISAFPFAYGYFGATVYRWIMPAMFIAFVAASTLLFGLKLGRGFGSLSEVYDYFSGLRKDIIAKAVLISFVVQFLNFLMVVILASAMGEKIPVVLLFVFLPIIITLTTIPVSVSGLGVREGSFVLLLGLIGVRPEIATSLSLSWFFANFIGGLPGLVAYIRHKEMHGSEAWVKSEE